MTGAGVREPPAGGRLLPFMLGAALFMQMLDSYAFATLMPAIARSLGVRPLDLDISLTAYYAGAAAMLPISGWCADRFGARPVFQASIIVFLVGALACGLAESPAQLLAARTAQGMSGAFLMPVARLVLLRTSERGELVRRLTHLTLPMLLGPMIGPVVGGAFATFGSWRGMFALDILVGLSGLVLVTRFVPRLREEHVPRLDLAGALLAGGFLVSFIIFLERFGESHRLGALETALLAATTACAAGYCLHSRRSSAPLLDLSLTRLQTFHAGTLGGLFFRMSVAAEPFLYAMLFQLALGFSAFASGLFTLAASVGTLLMRWLTDRPLRRFGFRRVLILNGVLCALVLAVPAFFTPSTAPCLIGGVLLLRGFFRSLQLNALNAITYAEAQPAQMGAASSLAAVLTQISTAIGMAAATSLISILHEGSTAAPVGRAIAFTFIVLSLLSLLSFLSFRRLPADAGTDMSGHRA